MNPHPAGTPFSARLLPPGPPAASLLAAAVATLVAAAYVLATNHIWEDYFITFRHSRNLATGHGLVFQPGERVHGFTSPLGVLLPAGFAVLFASDSYEPALLAFRIASVMAFASAVGILVAAARRSDLPGPAVLAIGLFLATEPKGVAFATNGMETAFALLFLALGLAAAASPADRAWITAGLAWAGLMWSRPDGVVPIFGLATGTLATAPAGLRAAIGGLARAAALAATIYLPWIGWASWYFGSPIPHTALAKASHGEAGGITDWLAALCGLSAATAFATARLAGARWPALATGSIVVAAFAVPPFSGWPRRDTSACSSGRSSLMSARNSANGWPLTWPQTTRSIPSASAPSGVSATGGSTTIRGS